MAHMLKRSNLRLPQRFFTLILTNYFGPAIALSAELLFDFACTVFRLDLTSTHSRSGLQQQAQQSRYGSTEGKEPDNADCGDESSG
jgi:hypothetical protein